MSDRPECDNCGLPYTPKQKDQRFCGPECKHAYWIFERREARTITRWLRAHEPGTLDAIRARMIRTQPQET